MNNGRQVINKAIENLDRNADLKTLWEEHVNDLEKEIDEKINWSLIIRTCYMLCRNQKRDPETSYSAIIIGRQMRHILAQNKWLRDRILTILSVENRTQQRMVEAMTTNEITEAQVKRRIRFNKQGIEDLF